MPTTSEILAGSYVAPIIYPGMSVVRLKDDPLSSAGPDLSTPDRANADSVLRAAVSALDRAAISLRSFEGVRPELSGRMAKAYEAHERAQVESGARAVISEPERTLRESEASMALWAGGAMPADYLRPLPLAHAEAFAFSLDRLRMLLGALGTEFDSAQIELALEQLDRALPGLRALRNSLAHLEDRVRGLNQKKKPIVPAGISNEMGEAPKGTLLYLSNLCGDRLGITAASGHLTELPVTRATADAARDAVQACVYAFDWIGFASVHPR